MALRNLLQEMAEMGARGTLFRVRWELQVRSDLWHRTLLTLFPEPQLDLPTHPFWAKRLPFSRGADVAACMSERISADSIATLLQRARDAAEGKIHCFGNRTIDFGDPIDWYLHPVSGKRWCRDSVWWRSLAPAQQRGDVKLTWEPARFPHAYHMARAAAFAPQTGPALATALGQQIREFTAATPRPLGIHWLSGQEIAVRLFAWLFALDALLVPHAADETVAHEIAAGLLAGAAHIERYISLARFSVYNNHLLAEAVALLAAGTLLPHGSHAKRWRTLGTNLLQEALDRQVYRDGAYIQASHNYHRVALQYFLWAHLLAPSGELRETLLAAMERSLTFLLAQQNPADGRLPNYGNNDGAMPSIWNTCAFADFRPTLQAVSLLTRGTRLYDAGPWDEDSAWLLGPKSLEAPLAPPSRTSTSFPESGYHVLRGTQPETFATFRCGNVRERFNQIDMLHVDLWWRGHNVLVDAGSYMYNDSGAWHAHFLRTASHNTLRIDNRDQMLHIRPFKSIYLTRGKLLDWSRAARWQRLVGEHYGYARHRGGCVHRRCVLWAHDDLWIVVDTLLGHGTHAVRLQWLGGPFPHAFNDGHMQLSTPEGEFSVATYDSNGKRLHASVVSGATAPPRGWLARHYADKEAVPSFAVERQVTAPMTWVSVLGAGRPQVGLRDGLWTVRGAVEYSFVVQGGSAVLTQDLESSTAAPAPPRGPPRPRR